MTTTNPYSSPESDGAKSQKKHRPWVFGSTTCLLGCACCLLAWHGASQLREIASPEFNGGMEELPIVRPVWDFFAPDSGTVVVAKVASSVQSTFLMLGLVGAIMIVSGVVLLYRGKIRSKNRALVG